MKKIIVALEGIDGAGKSSVINFITNKYKNKVIIYSRTKKGKIIDRIVTCGLLRKYHIFQVVIYFILSHFNFLKYKMKYKDEDIIIMDRCFLSNICYFYPSSLQNKRIFDFFMFFEPKLFPQKIFILDVDPIIAQSRDLYKKDLQWLNDARVNYLNAQNSNYLMNYDIEIIDRRLSLKTKANIVSNYIERVLKDDN